MRLGFRLLVVALAGVGCTWAVDAWVRDPFICNSEVSRLTGTSLLARRTRHSYDGEDLARKTLVKLQALQEQCRTNTNFYMLVALNEQITGDLDAALLAYRQALKIDQRPEIYLAAAEIMLERGQIDQALDAFAIAVRMAPSSLRHVPPVVRQRVAEATGRSTRDRGRSDRQRGDGGRRN